MMKEHKVGEKFAMSVNWREVMLEVVASGGCKGCFFDGDDLCHLDENILGSAIDFCSRIHRKDKTSVIFKEVQL